MPNTSLQKIRARLQDELKGAEELIEFSMAAFLGGGHLLLEGPPGSGKTSLAKALSNAFGGSFRRVQMTSDLLPSDIVGVLRLKGASHEFEFRPGPLFTHFLLADELNRTSPKTQSALLEAMGENTATVDGVTHPLPSPFFVVATQNPLEFHGVYPLAESQLDRFMLLLPVQPPGRDDEKKIYESAVQGESAPRGKESVGLAIEQTRDLLQAVKRVFIEETVIEYATAIVRETRNSPEVAAGVSVRGGLQLLAAARGLAFVRGRDYVTPRDITELAVPALAHRLSHLGDPSPDSKARATFITGILDSIPSPK